MRFALIIFTLLMSVSVTFSQKIGVRANTGSLIYNADPIGTSKKFSIKDSDKFVLCYERGYITQGAVVGDLFETGKTDYLFSLESIDILKNNSSSAIIEVSGLLDKSNKLDGGYTFNGFAGYYTQGVDLNSDEIAYEVGMNMKKWNYNMIGVNSSVFKEKERLPDIQIAGELINIVKETKGTPGHKVAILVNWSIYDVESGKVEMVVTSAGYSDSRKGGKYKEEITRALKNASLGLMGDKNFNKYVSSKSTNIIQKNDVLVLPKVENIIQKSYPEMIQASIGSVVTVKTDLGHGSGFVISDNGYVLTNRHVIAGSEKLEAVFNSGLTLPVSIVAFNKEKDVALLKIVGGGYTALPLSLNKGDVKLGVDVTAIGTPSTMELGQTVTRGIVSGNRQLDDTTYIQTDVSINSGNSGGPLINSEGEVIGVITAKISDNNSEGLGFAIPIEVAIEEFNIKFE
ncbi:MAG: trypsin-like peptidase domain-containing protein [Reichenbachiella sp.]